MTKTVTDYAYRTTVDQLSLNATAALCEGRAADQQRRRQHSGRHPDGALPGGGVGRVRVASRVDLYR